MYDIKRTLTALIVLAGCAAPRGFAANITLFDNLSDTTGGNTTIINSTPIGDQFWSGSAGILASLTVDLLRSSTATGSSTFYLYSDSSDSPGTLLDTLGTIPDSSLTTSIASYTFSNLNLALNPNTQYWIMGGATGVARWSSESANSGIGVTGEHFTVRGAGILPNTDGPWNMQVLGALATPEPGTLPLMAGGLAVALGWARRRKRGQA